LTDCGRRELVFEDSFEGGGYLDTDLWETSFNTEGHTSYYLWDVESSLCGYVKYGGYAVHCASDPNGSPALDCYQYANGIGNYLSNKNNLVMDAYDSYEFSFWTRHKTSTYFDGLRWGYIVDGNYRNVGQLVGNYDTWTRRGVGRITNTYGDSSLFKMYFGFDSDESVLDGYGTYIDSVRVRALPKASNLVAAAPSGSINPIATRWRQSGNPTDSLFTGQPTYIDWAVMNVGSRNVICAFSARLRIDGTVVKDTTFLNGLATGARKEVRTVKTFQDAEAGYHTVRMEVDYNYEIEEIDANGFPAEDDNDYETTLLWRVPADLVVSGMSTSPNPAEVGTVADVAVTIANQGSFGAQGPFRVVVSRDELPPTEPAMAGGGRGTGGARVGPGERTMSSVVDTVIMSGTLAVGQSRTFHLSRRSAAPAQWVYSVVVDDDNVVPEDGNEGNNVFASYTLSWQTAGEVSVSGTFETVDSTATLPGYTIRPLRRAKVVVFDSDLGADADDPVAYATTDEVGHFGPLTVQNYDADHPGRLDLYARVYLVDKGGCSGDSAFAVVDQFTAEPWSLDTSPVRQDVQSGTQVDFGVTRPDTTAYSFRAAAHIYGALRYAYDWAAQKEGCEPGVVTYWNPAADVDQTLYDSNYRAIVLSGNRVLAKLQPDEYDDGAITHEYGHHLQWIHHFYVPGDSTQPVHYWDQEAGNESIAFTEGWAGYFGAIVFPGARGYSNIGLSPSGATASYQEVDFEVGGVRYVPGGSWDLYGTKGRRWSMSCAGALWDFQDSVDDREGPTCGDHVSDGVGHSWQVVRDGIIYGPTLCHFYSEFKFTANPSHDPVLAVNIDSVMCMHGVAVNGCFGNNPESSISCECTLPITDVQMSGLQVMRGVEVRPNPLSDRVELLAGAGYGTRVSVRVFDCAGRRVRTLRHGQEIPGGRSFVWDVRDEEGRKVEPGSRGGGKACRARGRAALASSVARCVSQWPRSP
jgi:CARDB protein